MLEKFSLTGIQSFSFIGLLIKAGKKVRMTDGQPGCCSL